MLNRMVRSPPRIKPVGGKSDIMSDLDGAYSLLTVLLSGYVAARRAGRVFLRAARTLRSPLPVKAIRTASRLTLGEAPRSLSGVQYSGHSWPKITSTRSIGIRS